MIQLTTVQKELYNTLSYLVSSRIAVGGSYSLMAFNDPTIPNDYKPGDLDLVISNQGDMNMVHEYLVDNGFTQTIWVETSFAFTIKAQYKKDGEKFDFFIVPGLDHLSEYRVEFGARCVHPSVAWAARGFYAGIGSKKSLNQLQEGGLIDNTPRPDKTYQSEMNYSGKPTELSTPTGIGSTLTTVANLSNCKYKVGCVAAEVAALSRMTKAERDGSTVYCTLSPCADCEQYMIKNKVKEVFYTHVYSLNTPPEFAHKL
jgi:deoxycytidylate deaminase